MSWLLNDVVNYCKKIRKMKYEYQLLDVHFFKIEHEKKTQITTRFLDSSISRYREIDTVFQWNSSISLLKISFYLNYASDVIETVEENEKTSWCIWKIKKENEKKEKKEILFHVVLTNWCSLRLMSNKYVETNVE